MSKILVVEDQKDLLYGLKANLETEGYEVLIALRGDIGVNLAMSQNPDLVVLDIMLPGLNGLDVCRELRVRGFEKPIVLLTAKSDEIDRVLGLELGADDYVTKPFGLRELMARIRVRLRRDHSSRRLPTKYAFGDLKVDFEQMRTTRKSKPLSMTAKEYDLLRLLVRCKGEVLTRETVLREVWGDNCHVAPRTVDAHILKLRQKLEDDPTAPRYILTSYGGGYKFIG